MKREALEHTKLKRLRRRLNIPKWQAVGLLETLWHLAAKQTPRGDIGRLSDEDIAIGIDYAENEGIMIEALVASGWVDRHSEHRLLIHDWHEHCDDGVHMKLARAKLLFATGHKPKTFRLPKYERVIADNFFDGVRTDVESVRTAVRTDDENVHPPASYPRPAPPRPAPPIETLVGGSGTTTQTSPPKKSSSNGNGATARTEIERNLQLHEFAKNALLAYPGSGKLFGSPDDAVIGQCLNLCRGHPGHSEEQALGAALQQMAKARKTPNSSWMWFPRVLKQYLEKATEEIQ